jgi:hypothetical protein
MDFCTQPPLKIRIWAEKLLINHSQNVSLLISKACRNLCAYGFKNIFCFSFPVAGSLYCGLIMVIFGCSLLS